MKRRPLLSRGLNLLAPGVLAAALTCSAAHAETQDAVWTQKQADLVYMGFTSKYSCDGLYDKVRGLLTKMGARKDDLKIRRTGCSGPSGMPDPFPGVHVQISTLQPVEPSTDQKPIEAQWKTLEFRASSGGLLDRGDCELVEQLKQKILPLFATRNVEINQSCIPHQLPTGGTMLKLDVLTPTTKVASK